MALPFTDYTSNVTTDAAFVVTGDGMLDDLMETITAHVKAQFCDNKITGTDYATVYLGSLQAALTTSAKIFLERQLAEKQAELLDGQIALVTQQIAESAAKTALLTAQKITEDEKPALVIAQTLGFQVDGKQKLYSKCMESWAVYESVNKLGDGGPNTIDYANMLALYNDIITDLGGTAVT